MDTLWIVNIIAVFFICVFAAGILIPQILLIAYRKKLFDEPDERKIHSLPVPRLGGMAFALVIFFTLALMMGISIVSGHTGILTAIAGEIPVILFAFCATMLLYIVGIADDLIGVRYRAKFVIQILAAIMLITGGVYMSDLFGLVWINRIPVWLSYPLTILVVVFIINAINLIDGIDGLASGLCSVAFTTYGVTFLYTGDYVYAAIAFANLGVLLPFFYYNVFGMAENRTKIFMGDTGSLTTGLTLSLLSLKILDCVPTEVPNCPNPFVIAFVPLIIPCFDVVRVYFHRVRNGKNPFLPDKNHIHHKLLAVGMKPRIAMLTILLTSFLLVCINCVASVYVNINILFAFDVLFVTGVNIWLTKTIKNIN